MATFEERADKDGNIISIRVKIRRKGIPATSKTFDVMGPRQADINAAKREAEKWARLIESEMDRGVFVSRTESEQTFLLECLDRYEREVCPLKKGGDCEIYRIVQLKKHKLAKRTMASVRSADIAEYRDERLQTVKPATVTRELALLSHVFNMARREWGMENLINPVEVIRKPKLPQGRERRLLQGEQEALEAAAVETQDMPAIIRLVLETAMRRSEIVALRWPKIDLKNQYLLLTDTKNGEGRAVPLSRKAVALLEALPRRLDGRVFAMRADSITQAFERARARARKDAEQEWVAKRIEPDPHFLINLRFHDLRHEATSRLFEKGLNPMEAASITGHKDLRMLKRYTHLKAEDLAKKLG